MDKMSCIFKTFVFATTAILVRLYITYHIFRYFTPKGLFETMQWEDVSGITYDHCQLPLQSLPQVIGSASL